MAARQTDPTAESVIEQAKALPEEQRRQIDKFGQPSVAGTAGGAAAGGATGFGGFWVLNKLGFFEFFGFDLMDPTEVAAATAIVTALSQWLGRILNEWRKDNPDLARKLGLQKKKAA